MCIMLSGPISRPTHSLMSLPLHVIGQRWSKSESIIWRSITFSQILGTCCSAVRFKDKFGQAYQMPHEKPRVRFPHSMFRFIAIVHAPVFRKWISASYIMTREALFPSQNYIFLGPLKNTRRIRCYSTGWMYTHSILLEGFWSCNIKRYCDHLKLE